MLYDFKMNLCKINFMFVYYSLYLVCIFIVLDKQLQFS